jgi:hypothetical protein
VTDRQVQVGLRRAAAWHISKLPTGETHAWAMRRVNQLGGQSAAARVCGISKQRMKHYMDGRTMWKDEILERLKEAN